MHRALSRCMFVHAAAALLLAAPAHAQEKGERSEKAKRPRADSPKAVAPELQHAAGVIIKSEPIRKGAEGQPADTGAGKEKAKEKGRSSRRLTINMAAVWRDWVRDQVGQSPSASPREEAKRGEESVATKGEPATENTEVVVEVDASNKVETLFRLTSAGDSTSDARTPAEALAASGKAPASKDRGRPSSRGGESASDKTPVTRFRVSDLEPGLFVEVDFRRDGSRNVARSLAVIRPADGPDVAPSPTESKSKREKAKNRD